MPRNAASTTYEPLNPAPEQIHFPRRRKTIKRPSLPPRLIKQQSTLTQVGWIDTPTSSKMDPIIISTGDEDYAEPEPKPKKRKRSTKFHSRTESQPTYTQVVKSAPAKRAKLAREVDDEGFQIWRDPDDPGDTGMEAIAKRRKKRGELELLPTDWTVRDDSGYDSRMEPKGSPEIAESSSQQPMHEKEDEAVGVVEELANEDATPRVQFTPHNVRFREIPSSQSPASINLSTQRSQRYRDVDVERSPLEERDGNARSPMKLQGGYETQFTAGKMLQLLETQARDDCILRRIEEVDDQAGGDVEVAIRPQQTLTRISTVPDSTDTESEFEDAEDHTRPALEAPPSLKHFTTVQDSQYEDPEREDEDGGNETVIADAIPPPRALKRVTTVQDSQYDDLDLDLVLPGGPEGSDDVAEADFEDDGNDVVDDDEEDQVEGTYDPAYSALDRDAARFGQTQTQGNPLGLQIGSGDRPGVLDGVTEDTAEDVLHQLDAAEDAASHQLSQALSNAVEAVPSSHPAERGIPRLQDSQPPAIPTSPVGEPTFIPPESSIAEEERVPSSPPPLRPSQVSTVAPTQLSPARPLSRGVATQLNSTPPTKLSPLKAIESGWQETIEFSSPLPLPPWTSPERARYVTDVVEERALGKGKGKGKGKVVERLEMESLVDFSLPPPPPISSSRAGTQSAGASSSPLR